MRYEVDEHEFEDTCPRCNTKLFYTRKDIKSLGFLESHSREEADGKIVCPVCHLTLYVDNGKIKSW